MTEAAPRTPAWWPSYAELRSAADGVDLWCFSLDREAPPELALWKLLSQDEQQRANRFRFPRDRTRFVAARGLLRLLLANYLGLHAASMSFSYNAYGKPALALAEGQPSVRFNLSHSHEVAFVGVTRSHEIGVDVERITDQVDVELVGAQVFTAAERTAIAAMPPGKRRAAFFRYWACKEAVIKAIGTGFSLPPDRFTVWPDTGVVRSHRGEASAWKVDSLHVTPVNLSEGYTFAFVTACDSLPVRVWSGMHGMRGGALSE